MILSLNSTEFKTSQQAVIQKVRWRMCLELESSKRKSETLPKSRSSLNLIIEEKVLGIVCFWILVVKIWLKTLEVRAISNLIQEVFKLHLWYRIRIQASSNPYPQIAFPTSKNSNKAKFCSFRLWMMPHQKMLKLYHTKKVKTIRGLSWPTHIRWISASAHPLWKP